MIKIYEIQRGCSPQITFYDYDDVQIRSDDCVTEGFFVSDKELAKLKDDTIEAFLCGFEKDLMQGPMGIGRNDAMLLGELLAFARSYKHQTARPADEE